MKLCWDNIENIKLSERGNFRDIIKKKNHYLKICEKCGEEFFGSNRNTIYCSVSCASKRKHSEETKRKMSENQKGKKNSFYDKHHSEETKEKIRNSLGDKVKGDKNPFFGNQHSEETKKKIGLKNSNIKNISGYKCNYHTEGIPIYDTYAYQIEWCEEVRRNKEDLNILEVKCFKCNEWYIPKLYMVKNRIQVLKNNKKKRGEQHFYCSDQCKNSCSIYGKAPETIMKEDAIRAGRLPWLELTREVQPELREMVLERDENQCVKCDSTEDLQCHHIYPVNIEPLLSADIDNCVTLCKECHIKVHKKDGCKHSQLKMEEC